MRHSRGYQASERLFNIWYLMRYTSRWVRQKFTWLVEFMRLWYSTKELRGLAQARAQAHSQGGLRDGSQMKLSVANAEVLSADCCERYRLENSVFASVEQLARTGERLALFKLIEQAYKASAIGLSLALSELMAGSRYADFLQPMILALRAAENVPDALEGAAAEIKTMAAEVLADILAYRKSQDNLA